MKKWILKFYENDVIRYIFWGGCTTLVNLLSFYIMRAVKIPLMSANIISIILAILFAYVVYCKESGLSLLPSVGDHGVCRFLLRRVCFCSARKV